MKLAKEMLVYMGATVAEKAIPFLLLPILTKILEPAEYGMISVFTVLSALFSLLVGANLCGFIKVIYSKGGVKDFSVYAASSHGLFVAASFITLVTVVLFETQLSELVGLEPKWLYCAVVMGGMQYLISFRLSVYQVKRRPVAYAKVQLLKPLADLVLVLVLVAFLAGGVEGRLIAVLLSSILAAGWCLILLRRDGLTGLYLSSPHAQRALSFSLPLLPHSFAMAAVFAFDRMIISSGLGFDVLGIFTVALVLASPALIVADAINRAVMPWSFEQFGKGLDSRVVTLTRLLLVAMLGFCLVYSVVLWFGYDIIVDERYQKGRLAALILIWCGWFKLLYFMVAKGVVYSESMKYFPLLSLASGGGYILVLQANVTELNVASIAVLVLFYHFFLSVFTFVYSQCVFPQNWFSTSKNSISTASVFREFVGAVFAKK